MGLVAFGEGARAVFGARVGRERDGRGGGRAARGLAGAQLAYEVVAVPFWHPYVADDNVRALAFELPSRGLVQVSMNLIDPKRVGPTDAFERIAGNVVDCEVVAFFAPWHEHRLAQA